MQKVLESILNFIDDIQKVINKLWNFVAGIGTFIKRLLDWLIDYSKELPITIFDKFLTGLAEFTNIIIDFIPDSWINEVTSFQSYVSNPQINFWIAPFKPGLGLTLILSAYGIRFLIRRIPFIG